MRALDEADLACCYARQALANPLLYAAVVFAGPIRMPSRTVTLVSGQSDIPVVPHILRRFDEELFLRTLRSLPHVRSWVRRLHFEERAGWELDTDEGKSPSILSQVSSFPGLESLSGVFIWPNVRSPPRITSALTHLRVQTLGEAFPEQSHISDWFDLSHVVRLEVAAGNTRDEHNEKVLGMILDPSKLPSLSDLRIVGPANLVWKAKSHELLEHSLKSLGHQLRVLHLCLAYSEDDFAPLDIPALCPSLKTFMLDLDRPVGLEGVNSPFFWNGASAAFSTSWARLKLDLLILFHSYLDEGEEEEFSVDGNRIIFAVDVIRPRRVALAGVNDVLPDDNSWKDLAEEIWCNAGTVLEDRHGRVIPRSGA